MRPGARQGRFGKLTDTPGESSRIHRLVLLSRRTLTGGEALGWPWPVGLTDGLCQCIDCIGHALGPLPHTQIRFRCPLCDALAGVEDGRGTGAARAAAVQLATLSG